SEYAEHLTVNGFLLACMVTGYFLLGRWLVASRRVIDLPAYRHFLKRWSRVGLPAGLVLAGTACWYLCHGDMMVYDRAALLGSLLSLLAGVVLPLGYLATVILLSHRLSWLAPVGRMAL